MTSNDKELQQQNIDTDEARPDLFSYFFLRRLKYFSFDITNCCYYHLKQSIQLLETKHHHRDANYKRYVNAKL